jgi:hypothetical protein
LNLLFTIHLSEICETLSADICGKEKNRADFPADFHRKKTLISQKKDLNIFLATFRA